VRVIFAGTPRFATLALEALLDANHEVAMVLTQPDRPAGRGLQPAPSDVKRAALGRGLALYQPQSLKLPEALETLRAIDADVMVVAAYGLILPLDVLNAFPNGCINIHASLLPRWRGAAPIQRALLAGDAQTGISIMRMDAGLDTGAVLTAAPIAIAPDDTAGALHDRLAELGGRMIVDCLGRLADGPLEATPQDDNLATYAPKIGRAEAAIAWTNPAVVIERQVRAFDPFPGAHARFNGSPIKIWRASAIEGGNDAIPGTVLSATREGVEVACGGNSMLRIRELQRAGGRRLAALDFLRGHAIAAGDRIENGA
jgi:methionyl-tRNA formyltransferase